MSRVQEININKKKKYVFFVSHSTADISNVVNEICRVFEKCHINSYIADRDAPIGSIIPQEVKNAIEASELCLAVITKNSKNSPWVNQEIGYALGAGIPVLPLKKGRIKIKGLIESIKYVKINDNPLLTVKDVFSKLKGVSVSKTAEAAMLAVVGIMELMES